VTAARRASSRWPGPHASAVVAGLTGFAVQLLVVRRFYVSVPYWDEWDDAFGVLAWFRVHGLDWGAVFAQHTEHRIPVARLYFILIYSIFGEGNELALLTGHAVLMGIVAGLWVYALRRLGESPWLCAASVFVLLSLSQHENMLWGFQVEFYTLVLSMLAATCAIAFAERISWPLLLACAAGCAISTYSIASGVSAWVAVAVLLLLRLLLDRAWGAGGSRRRAWTQIGVLIALAAANVAAYLYHYVQMHPPRAATRSVGELAAWSLTALVFPLIDPLVAGQSRWLPLACAVVLGPIAAGFLVYWRRRDRARLLLSAGVMLMVLGNISLIGYGRSGMKFVASRYGTVCLWTSVVSLLAIAALLREARGGRRRLLLVPITIAAVILLAGQAWRDKTFVRDVKEVRRARLEFEHNVVSYLIDASPDRALPAFLPFPPEPIGPLLSDPNYLAVLPYNLRPPARVAFDRQAWAYEGVPPAVGRRPGFFALGSWMDGLPHSGVLTSAPFTVKGSLVVGVSGAPAAPGNSLALESAMDPSRRVVYSGPNPGERWDEWRIDASQLPGRHVRLVAVDGAVAPDGWLGVALPMTRPPNVSRLETFVANVEWWTAGGIALALAAGYVRRRPETDS
jgi:hypothetical protein